MIKSFKPAMKKTTLQSLHIWNGHNNVTQQWSQEKLVSTTHTKMVFHHPTFFLLFENRGQEYFLLIFAWYKTSAAQQYVVAVIWFFIPHYRVSTRDRSGLHARQSVSIMYSSVSIIAERHHIDGSMCLSKNYIPICASALMVLSTYTQDHPDWVLMQLHTMTDFGWSFH